MSKVEPRISPTLRQHNFIRKLVSKGHDESQITAALAKAHFKSKVYIITTPTGQPCKVGISRNPERRLKDLQTAHWLELYLHKVFISPPTNGANLVERTVLYELRNKALYGEWIDMEATELENWIRERFTMNESEL